MEVDEVNEVEPQVNKFQKVIRANFTNPNNLFPVIDGGGGGWPASRIVRVSRASGGKDRHSKVVTSKGLRDRRIRLSVSTAIEFYDLQDRLGFDQPSKAVEWLIQAAASSIDELPSLDPPGNHQFPGRNNHQPNQIGGNKKSAGKDSIYQQTNNSNSNSNSNNNISVGCSSTSETSKGSGHSISRSENRIRARERARERRNSSFTDLLTGGVQSPAGGISPMEYFQMQHFNIPAGDNQPEQNRFSFLQENFAPAVTANTGGGGVGSGLSRGTLQSNLVSCLPHQHHHVQRFQPLSMVDGCTSTNFQFFTSPASDSFPASGYDSQCLQLYGGGDAGGHYKGKSRN